MPECDPKYQLDKECLYFRLTFHLVEDLGPHSNGAGSGELGKCRHQCVGVEEGVSGIDTNGCHRDKLAD